MDWSYLTCENFRDFAEKDKISALLLCEVLNLNFDYFYNFDKQTGYVDEWATTDIYVYPSIQDFALEYIHQGLSYQGVYVNGRYVDIPVVDEYINLEEFGNALLDAECARCAHQLPNDKIIVMDYSR